MRRAYGMIAAGLVFQERKEDCFLVRQIWWQSVVVLLLPCVALGVGQFADPPISDRAVNVVGGPATCHINDATDKVELTASAKDYDDCNSTNNRINLAATTWSKPSGTFDHATGSHNDWTAGGTPGTATITVTFHDLDDGADYADATVGVAEAQVVLTGFKVGVTMIEGAVTRTLYEGETKTFAQRSIAKSIGFTRSHVSAHWSDTPKTIAKAEVNTSVSWTVITNPSNTLSKQFIKPVGGAKGENGVLHCGAADTDWLHGGSISITAGVPFVPLGFTWTLDLDDSCVALSGIVARFGSELHQKKKDLGKYEMVSKLLLDHRFTPIGEDFGTAGWAGKVNVNAVKKAQFKIERHGKAHSTDGGNNWAAASNGTVDNNWDYKPLAVTWWIDSVTYGAAP